MSERSHHHNPAAHSRSRPTREKGAVPFQLIGHHQLRTPRFHSPPCLGNGGSWIAGSRRLPLFPRKEGQARAELPHREPLTMHANRPLKDIACVLHAQTKDATVVCVIGCQITRTRIHTLPKRLASARHSRVRKLYSYQIHSARFKQTSQWRRKSWWCILPAALILWYAGSDVMGCRRPTGGVFTYVSSDRVTLRAFPVATPRGRSSSSHEGELICLFYAARSRYSTILYDIIYEQFVVAKTIVNCQLDLIKAETSDVNTRALKGRVYPGSKPCCTLLPSRFSVQVFYEPPKQISL